MHPHPLRGLGIKRLNTSNMILPTRYCPQLKNTALPWHFCYLKMETEKKTATQCNHTSQLTKQQYMHFAVNHLCMACMALASPGLACTLPHIS